MPYLKKVSSGFNHTCFSSWALGLILYYPRLYLHMLPLTHSSRTDRKTLINGTAYTHAAVSIKLDDVTVPFCK